MARTRGVDRMLGTLAVIGSLVLVNLLAVGVLWRLDLTRDKEFTLSHATRRLLGELEDPVTVRVYFTEDLPQPYATNRRYVRDLLEEYFAHSQGRLRYEFIDPAHEETGEEETKKKAPRRDVFGRAVREATPVERELRSLGIPPVQVQVNEGDKLEIKRAYMGLAISAGEKHEVIPVVQRTTGLEYDLTTLIRKLTRQKTPKVALITGHDGPDPGKELRRFHGLLEQLYEVTSLDLGDGAGVPADVDTLLVVAPRTPLSETEQRSIDDFVMSGRSAAFLLDEVHPELATLTVEETKHGLGEMLETYGVRFGPGLVLDAECGTLGVSRQQGFMLIRQPVRYPFLPVPRRLDPDHPLTRGLSNIAFPFTSPLAVTLDEESPVEAEVLVESSAKSWVETAPFDLNPFREWTIDPSSQGAHPLVIALSGPIRSRFPRAGQTPEKSTEPELPQDVAANARILVAGGASFLTDPFLSRAGEALVLNLMDWLVLNEDLLAVRSRGLAAAPLREIGARTRSTLELLHILLLPLAFVVLGLVRWRLREARRSRVGL